ncbi:hypothetical protein [Saccharothrix luteola]|uniref:hypothetical protein n=1 Tax=Saccharothrix luteola TaxID=2893018 RepID=UPI001E641660|nr:hypothetical protein [Saccharothrix luteola]MCC8249985.1 hypothetical protein [Saccharothrix luteola]
MPKLRTPAAVLALAVALPLVTAPAARAAALVTELPGLSGYPNHYVTAVNDLGQVVGTAYGNGTSHAVRWARDNTATDLGEGHAAGLNQVGQVLGLVQVPELGPYVQQPWIWHEGEVTDITPGGSGWVGATAINNRGEVPMTYSTSPYGYHQEGATVWRGTKHEGLSVGGGAHLSLSAINDAGMVVGSKAPMFGPPDNYAFRCDAAGNCARLAAAPGSGWYSVRAINEAGVVAGSRDALALRWEGDAVTVLSTSGGVAPGTQAINERGDVVGWSTESGVRRATLWPAGGGSVDLGVPGPSLAVAINDRGDVIGWTTADNANAPRAFVWRAGKVLYLGSPRGTHSRPTALNERGVIVGDSTAADGTVKAVKWTLITATPQR